MKSIKPGRGPSMLAAIVGIVVVLFGILWTVGASTMMNEVNTVFPNDPVADGMSVIFPLFGVIFVVAAVAGVVYNLKNATGKKRYSEFDIVDAEEEPDPLNERFGEEQSEPSVDEKSAFCPYCGKKIEGDYRFCNRCGKRLPE